MMLKISSGLPFSIGVPVKAIRTGTFFASFFMAVARLLLKDFKAVASSATTAPQGEVPKELQSPGDLLVVGYDIVELVLFPILMRAYCSCVSPGFRPQPQQRDSGANFAISFCHWYLGWTVPRQGTGDVMSPWPLAPPH